MVAYRNLDRSMCLCQQEFSKGFICKIALFYDLKSYIQSQQMQFCFQTILEKRYVKKAVICLKLHTRTHAHIHHTCTYTYTTHIYTMTSSLYIYISIYIYIYIDIYIYIYIYI